MYKNSFNIFHCKEIHTFLGDVYPRRIIVFQDGFNYDGDTLKSQNFKILDIRKVLELLEAVPNT